MDTTPTDPLNDRLVENLCDYQSRLERDEPASTATTWTLAVPQELQDRLNDCQRCLDTLNTVRLELGGQAAPPLTDDRIGQYAVPQRVGRFEITGAPCSGGFGIVFPGYDPVARREVAIKVPKPECLITPVLLERFRREAQAVSQLEHPNIVPVYEVGQDGMTPYLVMPLIPGETLAAWRDAQAAVTPRIAAEIVRQIAEGVACAHSLQVVHRDIKPGNILLAPLPGGAISDALGFVPKLTDFGLAKLLDADQPLTESGTVLGTAGFMSPEQVVGNSSDIGCPADIYSLGAVLYFLIAGEPPLSNAGVQQAYFKPHDEPPSLRARGGNVPLDFDVICQTCLEYSPSRRYGSARLLADDLRRFLNGEPLSARPISTTRRLGKWCRRHPAKATLAAATMLSLIALTTVSLWYNARLSEQLQEAHHARRTILARESEMRRRAYRSDMAVASRAWNSGNVSQTLTLLDRYRPQADEPDLRDFAWHFLWRQYAEPSKVLGRHAGGATAAAITRDGAWGASGGADGIIRLWSLTDGSLHREINEHHGQRINALAMSPDGCRLASVGDDGMLRVWEFPSGQTCYSRSDHQAKVATVAFSPDGSLLATGGADRAIRLWNAASGEPLGTLTGHTDLILQVAFHPDGITLASASKDGTIRLWNVSQQTPDERLPDGVLYRAEYHWPRTLAVSPDGKYLASSLYFQGVIRLSLQPETLGRLEHMPEMFAKPAENVRALAWPQDEMLAAASMSILLASAIVRSSPVFELAGHSDSIFGLAAAADGTRLLSASSDGEVRCWTLTGNSQRLLIPQPDGKPRSWTDHHLNGLSLGRQLLARQGDRGEFWLLDHTSGKVRHNFFKEGDLNYLFHLTADDRLLIDSPQHDRLNCFSVETGKSIWQFQLPQRENHQRHEVTSSTAKGVVAAPSQADVFLLSLETGGLLRRVSHPLHVHDAVFLDQSDRPLTLITACRDGYLRFWNVATGELLTERFAHHTGATALALSADGTLLASGGYDRTARIWRVDDMQEVVTLSRRDAVLKLGFFGPHHHLVCGDASLSLWDLDGPTELMQFSPEYATAFFDLTPDGNVLAIQKGSQVELIRYEP